MTPALVDSNLPESGIDDVTMASIKKHQRGQWILRTFLIAGALLILGLVVTASRYQPLSIGNAAATWKTRGTNVEMTVSLSTTLSNIGPLGVEVTALRPKLYADPPVSVTPLRPCFQYFKKEHWCPQDKNGYFTGDRFRPFILKGSNTIPVIWRYSFSCLPRADGSTTSGPVEVRVTYRFGIFTHDVLLVLPGAETTIANPSGPCGPAG